MKKHLIILTALGVGSMALAQQPGASPEAQRRLQQELTSSPEVREFLNSPQFARSIVAGYGVDAEISPSPESADIQAITAVQELLQADTTESLIAGVSQLEQYMNGARGREGNRTHSAVIPQLIGSVYFRLATMVQGEQQQQQFMTRARENLQLAVEMFPSYRQAHKNLARIHFTGGNPAGAVPHFVKSIELGDREPATYVLLSKIYFDQERFTAAESAARQAMIMAPSLKEARTLLGYSLFQQGRFDEARAVFQEMLQTEPNSADLWQMVSNAYIQTNQIDEAARVLEIVRFMGAAQSQTLLLLGDVYMNKNMVEDAAEAYGEALNLSANERSRQPIDTFLRPVETLNNYQAYDLAMDLLNQIEQTYSTQLTDETRNDILALRSEINIALGQGEEAAGNLRQILEIDPMNRRALLSLGQYYARFRPSGDLPPAEARAARERAVQRALNYFRTAQELIGTGQEDDEEAARQAYIGEGQLLAQERRLQEALSALREAQAIRQEDRIASYIDMIQQVVSRS